MTRYNLGSPCAGAPRSRGRVFDILAHLDFVKRYAHRFLGSFDVGGYDGLVGIDPGPTKTMRGWHGKDWTYNRAFLDAHAESQRIYIEGTEEEGYALHYRNECTQQNESAGNCAPCVQIRGDGWQKDTLPAEFIPTKLLYGGQGRASYEDCVQGAN